MATIPSNESIVSEYTKYARTLRQALLDHCNGSAEEAQDTLRHVFNVLDDNSDGVLTVDELRKFLSTLILSGADCDKDIESDPHRFFDVLLRQLDTNHDNQISYAELSHFCGRQLKGRGNLELL